jgi:hypothetical protein
LEINGRCVRRDKEFKGPLRFWGEWEAQSKVAKVEQPLDGGPRFLHRPFYVVPDSYIKLQNTDPFVFGGFFYTGCQQRTKRGPTQLRYLEQGSVILFGSCVGGRFAIDTVFVVDKWEDHDPKSYTKLQKLKLPTAYLEVTLAAWYGSGNSSSCLPSESFRLYWGATIDNPVHSMFSYVPCQPAAKCGRGFARPVITIPGLITSNLPQGKRLNKGLEMSFVVRFWMCVREQVERAGQWLAVSLQTPERLSSMPAMA